MGADKIREVVVMEKSVVTMLALVTGMIFLRMLQRVLNVMGLDIFVGTTFLFSDMEGMMSGSLYFLLFRKRVMSWT